jgi:putative transposase
MLSVRHPLSLRNGEALLHERGIEIRYETVRFWWNRLGLSSSAKEGQKAKENLSQLTACSW